MEPTQEDTAKHHWLRLQLVNQLRAEGITDERVLTAIGQVPRHFFIDAASEPLAYENRPLPIGEGQTISQPYTVAYQSQLLEVFSGQKVLEVGTGSGYQSVVLALMGTNVYTMERQQSFFRHNRQFAYLQSFTSIHFFYGDGYRGLPEYAPFDRILLTAAAPSVPDALLEQLIAGGILVAPLGEEGFQRMKRIRKTVNGLIEEEDAGPFSFVPMLHGLQG
ncbi:MAG TPA: protein-L-isoaspartate(D-aspartate) O-methyltransferase [Sediminibacterium sp.]